MCIRDRPNVALSIGISALSSMVMGAYSLQDAVDYGLAELSDPSFAEDVQNAIGWDKKPINITYF